MEVSPAVVPSNPRDARFKTISPTDDQPPPRQEGEAVATPWLRKIRDGAGGGGWEQFDIGDVAAADHDLP